ncbi:all trans-polyprenyl-diphosphate synthase PDSS1-like [Daphnia pulicaria]|uniref:all trans-polyprenyl-diphosphate synthase PDSS1-like n=1 Tax=Daphnia pulicaria TaxID=35523 RepID=UPI001EECDCE8|nr:all trans-polyprenyl-diphosphate synthase PDSS1-like [Daphnia pulicaria]XP_046635171.1 all trans-polyprenyl-diphosphate synthase PDSS1-like [Daphnia pulicaria]
MSGFLSSQRLALQLASRHFREGYSGLFKHQCLLSKHTPLLKHENQIQTGVPNITNIATAVPKTENFGLREDVVIRQDLTGLYNGIRESLSETQATLVPIAQYYFDGQGKAIRPVITMLMAKAINYHLGENSRNVVEKQMKIAQIVEMIHTASLVHDDVVDAADSRRNKSSVNKVWGQKKSILAGNYVVGRSIEICTTIESHEVLNLITKIVSELVSGELMQLDGTANKEEWFDHYLEKTFKKTASLIANGCQAVSVVAGASSATQTSAFQFGRQLGMAFQLVDDLLDFVSTSAQLGKPAAADLRLGLATAPVLYAARKFPELNALILRRFKETGDVETAFDLVLRSDGLQRTKELAGQYCDDAVTQLAQLSPSPYQQALFTLTHELLNRMK